MIRYPAGSKPFQSYRKKYENTIDKLGTPPKISVSPTISNANYSFTEHSTGGRGMSLEKDINETNVFYNETARALVFKKPTPINIVHVDYPKRSAAVIREAYFQKPSTVDYSGVYRGRALEFEAKETRSKTNFPLDNFHEHQIEHLRKALYHGAIAFVIVRFTTLASTYLLDAEHVIRYFDEQRKGGRKSIPFHVFQELGHLIQVSYGASVDYLQVVDQVYF